MDTGILCATCVGQFSSEPPDHVQKYDSAVRVQRALQSVTFCTWKSVQILFPSLNTLCEPTSRLDGVDKLTGKSFSTLMPPTPKTNVYSHRTATRSKSINTHTHTTVKHLCYKFFAFFALFLVMRISLFFFFSGVTNQHHCIIVSVVGCGATNGGKKESDVMIINILLFISLSPHPS